MGGHNAATETVSTNSTEPFEGFGGLIVNPWSVWEPATRVELAGPAHELSPRPRNPKLLNCRTQPTFPFATCDTQYFRLNKVGAISSCACVAPRCCGFGHVSGKACRRPLTMARPTARSSAISDRSLRAREGSCRRITRSVT